MSLLPMTLTPLRLAPRGAGLVRRTGDTRRRNGKERVLMSGETCRQASSLRRGRLRRLQPAQGQTAPVAAPSTLSSAPREPPSPGPSSAPRRSPAAATRRWLVRHGGPVTRSRRCLSRDRHHQKHPTPAHRSRTHLPRHGHGAAQERGPPQVALLTESAVDLFCACSIKALGDIHFVISTAGVATSLPAMSACRTFAKGLASNSHNDAGQASSWREREQDGCVGSVVRQRHIFEDGSAKESTVSLAASMKMDAKEFTILGETQCRDV